MITQGRKIEGRKFFCTNVRWFYRNSDFQVNAKITSDSLRHVQFFHNLKLVVKFFFFQIQRLEIYLLQTAEILEEAYAPLLSKRNF